MDNVIQIYSLWNGKAVLPSRVIRLFKKPVHAVIEKLIHRPPVVGDAMIYDCMKMI